MRLRKARHLTKAELRTMGATPGLMARRYAADGRARLQRGKVYVMRHYHVCGDEVPGADCSGGCFSGEAA